MHFPFVDSSVDNGTSDFSQLLFEFIDILKQCPINSLLHNASNIVKWTVIRGINPAKRYKCLPANFRFHSR